MRIGLIIENSQAVKSAIIERALRDAVEPLGHEVVHYGMYSEDDEASLTYVQNGILAAIVLGGGAVDYVVTGCGTGEGAMIACNSMPGVVCGHVSTPLDAYLFAQVNDGNAIAIPFAQGFGWGAELQLYDIFTRLFSEKSGQGYPKERVEPEQRNKRIVDAVRETVMRPLPEVLGKLDRELVRGAIAGEHFADLFFAHATNGEVIAAVKGLCA